MSADSTYRKPWAVLAYTVADDKSDGAENAFGPCEVVVVGRRGRSAVKRLLLGSVADRLVQICTKPGTVVR